MKQMTDLTTRQFVMSEFPEGRPEVDEFKMIESVVPDPADGEAVIRTLYLRMDPGTRSRMNPPEDSPYETTWDEQTPLSGGAIGKIVESRHPDFEEGDIVVGRLDWGDYSVRSGDDLREVPLQSAPPRTFLGSLGHTGRTAYFGMIEVGDPQPEDTVVVSAAAGAVGSVAAQIARIKGSRVVGIAGSDEKVDFLTDDLGLDAGINYKTTDDMSNSIQEACPDGVDVYFDNVGGELSDAVKWEMNEHGRIAQCGRVAIINESETPTGPREEGLFIKKRLLKKGFVVYDYADRYEEAERDLEDWYNDGELVHRETIVEGLENTPSAWLGLFEGDNIGKLLVKVGDE